MGPQPGASVVAKAWTDPDFPDRLLTDASVACAELGIGGVQGEDMNAVETLMTCTM